MVGLERETANIAPTFLPLWELYRLEPSVTRRNLRYLIMVPSNESTLLQSRVFAQEMQLAYNLCQLGTHMMLNEDTTTDAALSDPIIPVNLLVCLI